MFGHILAHTIEAARRHERGFALLFIDLDRFKTINDSLGHEAGDQLLCEVASRLKGALRASDVVARLAGDEFVALLDETDSAVAAAVVAHKLLSTLAQPLRLGAHELRVTASIGIARYPQDGSDEATLLKNADLAMYLAKEAGKNNFQHYDAASRTAAMQRLSIEQQLRQALERHEFTLQFQAKLDLASDRIVGVEALLRWHNAELGAVMPAEFIPISTVTPLASSPTSAMRRRRNSTAALRLKARAMMRSAATRRTLSRYRLLSTFHFYLAEPDRTLEYAEQGLRLAPRDFHTASFLLFKGWGHFMKGEDEEALVWMRKAAAASPDSPSILAPFSAVLALTGHLDEARATMARYLSLKRARNRTVAGWSRLPDDNPGFRAFVVRLQDGLRKAGMPEE